MFVVFSIAFLLHTIHQLRMVDRIQSMAPDISLFHTRPVYALSALTARTGIGIAMFVYWVAYLNYGLEIFGPQAALLVIDLSITGLLLLTSSGAFVIPLLGMHERLVKEKNRALYEVNERIELVIARLHAKVDSTSADETDAANKNLESLLLEAETLSKTSTWPWSPETLRTFLGAIALPVIVWLITTALDRFILD